MALSSGPGWPSGASHFTYTASISPGFVEADQRAIDRKAEIGIVAADDERVGFEREILVDEFELVVPLRELQSRQHDPVGRIGIGLAREQQRDALGAGLDRHELRGHVDDLERLLQRGQRGRARDDGDLPALQVGQARQVILFAHQHAAAIDEDGHREVDALHPGERDGRGAALGIGLAGRHGIESIRRVHRPPFDLHRRDGERLADGRRHLLAQFDGIALRAPVARLERKRRRAVAIGEGDGAGRLDPVQRRRRRGGDCRPSPAAATAHRKNRSRLLAFGTGAELVGICSAKSSMRQLLFADSPAGAWQA